MADTALNNTVEVARLKHHEDLEKVSDIIVTICEEKNTIGFRFTCRPATEFDVLPQKFKFAADGYNPSKEELAALPSKERK